MNPTKPQPAVQLIPSEIVRMLDEYIIGQDKAKRAVAIALRNRWRRQQVTGELKDEIYPNNIILIGPTGVGKTEIARRLANLAGAPFVKVEASKYTEVGYVGRDVESMIRDLVDVTVARLTAEQRETIKDTLDTTVEERLLDLLHSTDAEAVDPETPVPLETGRDPDPDEIREDLRKRLRQGELDDQMVTLDVEEDLMPTMQIFSSQGLEEMGINLPQLLGDDMKRRKTRRVTVPEAREILFEQEMEQQIDREQVVREALRRTETSGIVFFDEIDKIAAPSSGEGDGGPDVSRSGVQRDILPVVEGTTVATKYGMVRTDHILFIAAGAFTATKPSDLIPELQGRFPIRVEMDKLGEEEFYRILTEPKNALVKQYTELLATENVKLTFTRDAQKEIAATAYEVNQRTEDIGARRLHTVLTTLLEDILFDAPNVKKREISITRSHVRKMLADIVESEDQSRFIL